MIALRTKSGRRKAAGGKRLALLFAALFLISACYRDNTAVSQSIDDATISTRVKTALLNEPGVSFTKVDVETDHGVVTLTGTVGSKEEEQKVIAVSRGVKGVRDVKSSLQIQD